jgi:outer membrane protein insertion porin family
VIAFSASPSIYAFVTNPNHGDLYEINAGFGQITNGVRYKTLALTMGWAQDTRNRAIFADRGMMRSIIADVAVYPGDVQWYSLRASQTNFFPLGSGFTIGTDTEITFVQPYGTSADVPPDRKLFGGGADSVRGFRDAYLGPSYLNSSGQVVPTGGNLRTSMQSELLLPNFFADDPTAPPSNGRFGIFLDVGMVFAEVSDFNVSELRAATGLAASFLTPVGAMRFSFAYPLRSEDTDETERFQFTIGTLF